MNQLMNVILMMPPKEGQQGSSSTQFLIMMLLIFVVFYFFMIRPQVKRQKEMKNFREGLKKGDKIVTTGGIYGKIAEINDNIITIEIEDKVKMKVDKSAIIRDPSDMQNQK
jgi:preprotein translocase subunit YajC